MKTLVPLLAIAATTALMALPAHADRGGHGARHGHHHGHYGFHHGHRHGHHHGHHHGHRHGIWGPLIVGGLIGAAIVGSQAQAHTPVQPVWVPPAPPPVPSHLIPAPAVPPLVTVPAQPQPPRVHYYCGPYRAYYPFVTSCPEPWHVLSQ